MADNIRHIKLTYVNCYLIKTGGSFILIDTGVANKRKQLEAELTTAGCKPGNLKLIIITHGDSDHTGNAAWLREKYGAKIAMHTLEAAAAESGSMTTNRGKIAFLPRFFLSIFKLAKKDRYKADLLLENGYDFAVWGWAAKVLHIPGHSLGSIAVFTEAGTLFCGDLLTNLRTPAMTDLIDDRAAALNSVEILKSLPSKIVYPGHGEPFAMEAYTEQ